MEKVCEELDEVKVENEKLRADYKSKAELCEHLKKIQNEQVTRIQGASSKIEKQAQELLEKEEELCVVKQVNQELNSSLKDKESIIKHLNAANDKLRAESDEKSRTWEEENRRLVLAFDEASEKNIDQEQNINVLKAEIEGLKAHLSVAQKKCSEAERKAKNPRELRERDDLLDKVEEDKRKVADQLKWKREQFKHLEEAHQKLKDEFKVSKREWEKEKSTLLDEICSLQTKLDSQIRINVDLQNRLQMCNHALAHEETRRKYLEAEVSEFKARFENIFAEYQDAKAQLDSLNSQRDNEVATLRHLLGTKESFYKEMEYQAGKLEQENQELMTSLKELQEARIQEAGSSPSLSKLKHRLKSVEQMHKESSVNFRAKEAEWNSQREEMIRKLNDYSSQLESKDALKAHEMELEGCLSSAVQLKLQNEEISVMLILLKSGMAEAQLKLADVEAELGLREKERVENLAILRQQLEMKNIALANALRDIAEERERTSTLARRVDTLDQLEDKNQLMQKELNRCKEMLEESSRFQLQLKEQALHVENDSHNKIREVSDALDVANSELAEKREKVACLSGRVESLELIEGQQLHMQKELQKYKEKLEEASWYQIQLEQQAFQMESESGEKLREVCEALERAKFDLNEEQERTASLIKKVESLNHIEEQWLQTQKELEEALRSQHQLAEQAALMKNEFGERLQEVRDALETANVELAEEREKTASLIRRIESSDNLLEEHWASRQKELDRYKEMFEESSRYKLQLEEKISQIESDSERRLAEVCNALDKANSELVDKICEGHEIEFELWVWKSIAERLKYDLEASQDLRKELEASLLAQVEVAETKEQKDNLVSITKEKDGIIVNLEQQIVSLEQELKMREKEAVTSADERILHITREQDKMLEDLQKEIGLLEEESLQRELEGAAFAHIGAERIFEHEKGNLLQLVKEKDQRIDSLMQVMRSMEEEFNGTLNSFSSELAEKQAQITLVHEAWEKIARAEILAKLEIEEKKLMIVELEDDIHNIQGKLLSQEKSVSDTKQLALNVEAELEAKRMEMKILADQMEARLRTSEALVDKLRSEKTNMLEDIMKLSMERENLLRFVGEMGDRITEFATEDSQLMGIMGRILQSFDDSNSLDLKGSNELFDSPKENKNGFLHSPATKRPGSVIEERSPFRQLN